MVDVATAEKPKPLPKIALAPTAHQATGCGYGPGVASPRMRGEGGNGKDPDSPARRRAQEARWRPIATSQALWADRRRQILRTESLRPMSMMT